MQPHPEISRLPSFEARMNALDDFEQAVSAWDRARRELRWGWRYDHRTELRRAMRYWRRYAEQIKPFKRTEQ